MEDVGSVGSVVIHPTTALKTEDYMISYHKYLDKSNAL